MLIQITHSSYLFPGLFKIDMYNLYQIGKKKKENYEKKLVKMGKTKNPSKDPDMEEYLLFSDLIDILKDLESLENEGSSMTLEKK